MFQFFINNRCLMSAVLFSVALNSMNLCSQEESDIERVLDAIRGNKTDEAQELIQAHPQLVNALAADGIALLHYAAMFGTQNIVEFLVDRGADISVLDEQERIPLHYATGSNNNQTSAERVAIVEFLVARGADVNARDEKQKTPLHYANTPGVAEFLINHGAEIDARDSRERTPLHDAAMFGTQDVVALLVTQGARIDAKDSNGEIPVHFAAAGNHIEVIRILLKPREANINAKCSGSWASLHKAASRNHRDAVACLLSLGADVNDQTYSGCTPLFLAAQNGHLATVRFLLAYGADIEIGSKDPWPESVLVRALRNGHFDVAQELVRQGANVMNFEEKIKEYSPPFIQRRKAELSLILARTMLSEELQAILYEFIQPLEIEHTEG